MPRSLSIGNGGCASECPRPPSRTGRLIQQRGSPAQPLAQAREISAVPGAQKRIDLAEQALAVRDTRAQHRLHGARLCELQTAGRSNVAQRVDHGRGQQASLRVGMSWRLPPDAGRVLAELVPLAFLTGLASRGAGTAPFERAAACLNVAARATMTQPIANQIGNGTLERNSGAQTGLCPMESRSHTMGACAPDEAGASVPAPAPWIGSRPRGQPARFGVIPMRTVSGWGVEAPGSKYCAQRIDGRRGDEQVNRKVARSARQHLPARGQLGAPRGRYTGSSVGSVRRVLILRGWERIREPSVAWDQARIGVGLGPVRTIPCHQTTGHSSGRTFFGSLDPSVRYTDAPGTSPR